MIDLAVHAAGLAAIPVAALLRRRGVPGALSLLVEQALHRISGPREAADPWSSGLDGARLPAPLVATPPPAPVGDACQAVVDALPESVFRGALLAEALHAAGDVEEVLEASDPERRFTAGEAFASGRALLRSLLDRVRLTDGAPLEAILVRLLERTRSERAIVASALATLPHDGAHEDAGTHLLVCHGVDLEYRLGAPPRQDLMDQLARLRLLALAAQGRAAVFVPCDPWRPQALAVVREGLDRGFVGVSLSGSSILAAEPAGRDRFRMPNAAREAATRLREVLGHCAKVGAPVAILLSPADLDGTAGVRGPEEEVARLEAWGSLLDHRRLASLRVVLLPPGPGFQVESQEHRGRGTARSTTTVEVDDALEAALSLTASRPRTWCALSPALAAVGPAAAAETAQEATQLWRQGIVGAVRRSKALTSRLCAAASLPHGDAALVVAGRANLPAILKAARAESGFGRRFDHDNALELLDLGGFLRRCRGSLGREEEEALGALVGRRRRIARAPAPQAPLMPSLPPRTPTAPSMVVAASAVAAASVAAAPQYDCIVVGAGIAGVTAAQRISRLPNGRGQNCRVLVLEASQRIGGRVHSWRDGPHGPLELGAELVHRPPLDQVIGNFSLWDDLSRFSLETRKIDKLSASHVHARHWSTAGPLLRAGCGVCSDAGVSSGMGVLNRAAGWTTTGSTPDRAAGDLLSTAAPNGRLATELGDLLLTGTVPGRLHELSVAGLAADRVKDQEMSVEEFHVQAGFDALVAALAQSVDVRLGAEVTRITRGPAGVSVGCADGSVLLARSAVCTVSVGVLKSGAMSFDPPLPIEKREAMDRLELGPISKGILFFDRAFWPPSVSLLANLDPARRAGRSYFVPLYGSDSSAPVITGLFNGDLARTLDAAMGGLPDADSDASLPGSVRQQVGAIMQDAADDLREIFGDTGPTLRRWRVRSWANDPFARGGTSFVRFEPGSTSRDAALVRRALQRPSPPLFWAGEATAIHTNPWSVHGAHASGVQAAREVGEFLRPIGDW